LIIHGRIDSTIPILHSKKLFHSLITKGDLIEDDDSLDEKISKQSIGYYYGNSAVLRSSVNDKYWFLELEWADHNDLMIYDLSIDTIREFINAE
jgi:hypothetical protein